jgi:hypothetical protein
MRHPPPCPSPTGGREPSNNGPLRKCASTSPRLSVVPRAVQRLSLREKPHAIVQSQDAINDGMCDHLMGTLLPNSCKAPNPWIRSLFSRPYRRGASELPQQAEVNCASSSIRESRPRAARKRWLSGVNSDIAVPLRCDTASTAPARRDVLSSPSLNRGTQKATACGSYRNGSREVINGDDLTKPRIRGSGAFFLSTAAARREGVGATGGDEL